MLVAVGAREDALDVTGAAKGDHDLVVRLQVLAVEVVCVAADVGSALRAVLLLNGCGLVFDRRKDLLVVGQKLFHLSDGFLEFLVLCFETFALQCGQTPKLHIKDGLGLRLVESEPCDQFAASSFGAVRRPNQPDDLVQVADRDAKPCQNVSSFASATQVVLSPAPDDLLAEEKELVQRFSKRDDARHPVHQSQHVGRERGLQCRVFV